jgi:preprotein translocase subunit SecG
MTLNFLNIIHVLLAVALIGFILVQRGPGATAGSAFGSGASSTVFGAKGSGSFLTKTTAILATLFFALSMLMAVQANRQARQMMQSGDDLGVVGSLQEKSDVPAINPGTSVENNSEVPAMDDQAMKKAADIAKAMQDKIKQAADGAATEVGNAVEAAKEVTGQTAKEAAEAVQSAADKVAEKAAENNAGGSDD